MGLRRKEAALFRPYQSIVSFSDTGLPPEQQVADRYARIQGKGGRVRFIPLDSPARQAAVAFAQEVVVGQDAHLGDPTRDLKRNLRRFDYVLEKFGITFSKLGVTAHGLPSPVRGGADLPPAVDEAARQAVSNLAGHVRTRASGAYLGQSAVIRSKGRKPSNPPMT
jgi:hypothetical protein